MPIRRSGAMDSLSSGTSVANTGDSTANRLPDWRTIR